MRYVVNIRVYAAADPLEISSRDLAADHDAEIRKLVAQCEKMTEEDLMRDVYVELEYSLCSSCQKAYLSDPMPA